MRRSIPFVKNHHDDLHCVAAVFRMVHRFYFGKDLSWDETDRMLNAVPGKGTWTISGEMELAKKGLEVINIEPVDYDSLYNEGVDYLSKIVGKKVADYYLNNSNISSVIKYIPEYLNIVKHETRRATIKEIINYLKQSYLIGAEINSRLLNKQQGLSLHFVLLYDFDGKNILLHDPGLPPIKARKISIKEFHDCFNFKGANGGIVLFRSLIN